MPYLHVLRLLNNNDSQYSYKCKVLGHIQFDSEDAVRLWWDMEGCKVWPKADFGRTGRSGWVKDVGVVVRSDPATTGQLPSVQWNELMVELSRNV